VFIAQFPKLGTILSAATCLNSGDYCACHIFCLNRPDWFTECKLASLTAASNVGCQILVQTRTTSDLFSFKLFVTCGLFRIYSSNSKCDLPKGSILLFLSVELDTRNINFACISSFASWLENCWFPACCYGLWCREGHSKKSVLAVCESWWSLCLHLYRIKGHQSLCLTL
jgi:hypothetical protein